MMAGFRAFASVHTPGNSLKTPGSVRWMGGSARKVHSDGTLYAGLAGTRVRQRHAEYERERFNIATECTGLNPETPAGEHCRNGGMPGYDDRVPVAPLRSTNIPKLRHNL